MNFLTFNQIGFSKDFRTTDFTIKTLINEYLSKTENCIYVLLVFEKHLIVFDSINHC